MNSNYFESYNKSDCNGCGVCSLKCPKHAITMKADSEGFLYPFIDKNKCINCNLCKNICPNKKNRCINKEVSYISYIKDNKAKKNSASGGIFYAIAKYILDNKGVVFGVMYNDLMEAVHSYTENMDDLVKFQGSKYVRSDLGDSYKNVEKFLKDKRLVLFTGTPCQCQGLRTYLMKEYDNLITCEIICHANPSPKVFKMYIQNLEEVYGKKVQNVIFRSKDNGWKNQTPVIIFIDGSKIEEFSYRAAFATELINRPSCHNCRFCDESRYSDFTIGDMWGIEKITEKYNNDDSGLSLLCVNTIAGKRLLLNIRDFVYLEKVDMKLAFSYNHHCNVPYNKYRTRFFKMIENGNIDSSNIINYMKKYSKGQIFKRLFDKFLIIICRGSR